MPETPDFPTIALRVITDLEAITGDDGPDPPGLPIAEIKAFNAQTRQMMAVIAEQLRLVWNARGAADIAKLEDSLTSLMGATASGPYVKNLDRALRTLDR